MEDYKEGYDHGYSSGFGKGYVKGEGHIKEKIIDSLVDIRAKWITEERIIDKKCVEEIEAIIKEIEK